MKYRYTKFTGDLLDEIDLQDLVSKLSDLLLSSGFGNPRDFDAEERTMQALHDAILDALFNGGVLPEETIEKLLGDPSDGDQEGMRNKLEELIQQLIERMGNEGYITLPPDMDAERQRRQGQGGTQGPDQEPQLFEVTETFHMETQPQLLLLQKSMLVCEGVGRKLAPDVNMWTLAEPLITAWMIENRGPAARTRELFDLVVARVDDLPNFFSNLERATAAIAQGVKLNPEALAALGGRSSTWWWMLAALVLGVVLGKVL